MPPQSIKSMQCIFPKKNMPQLSVPRKRLAPQMPRLGPRLLMPLQGAQGPPFCGSLVRLAREVWISAPSRWKAAYVFRRPLVVSEWPGAEQIDVSAFPGQTGFRIASRHDHPEGRMGLLSVPPSPRLVLFRPWDVTLLLLIVISCMWPPPESATSLTDLTGARTEVAFRPPFPLSNEYPPTACDSQFDLDAIHAIGPRSWVGLFCDHVWHPSPCDSRQTSMIPANRDTSL